MYVQSLKRYPSNANLDCIIIQPSSSSLFFVSFLDLPCEYVFSVSPYASTSSHSLLLCTIVFFAHLFFLVSGNLKKNKTFPFVVVCFVKFSTFSSFQFHIFSSFLSVLYFCCIFFAFCSFQYTELYIELFKVCVCVQRNTSILAVVCSK